MEKIYLEHVSDFEEGVCFTSNWTNHYWKVLSVSRNLSGMVTLVRLAVYDKQTDDFESELDWNVDASDLNGFYYHKGAPDLGKYGKIIKKIRQMDARRKELGYVF